MLNKENRSHDIGSITLVDAATDYNMLIRGSLMAHPYPTIALDNITASTDLFIGYVDAFKSTIPGETKANGQPAVAADEDWQFSFARIPAKTYKQAASFREFNIGETLSTLTSEALTWGTTVSAAYYVVKIVSPIAQNATVTHGTIVKCSRKTSATVIPLVVGVNSFMVLNDTGQTDCHIDLETSGTNVLHSVHLATDGSINQLENWY